MNKKFLVYSLVGLLSSGAAAGFVLANSKQAQSIIKSQNAEIAQMQGWQQAWNP